MQRDFIEQKISLEITQGEDFQVTLAFACDSGIICRCDIHSGIAVRSWQRKPIVVIKVQQRLQYSSPSSQRSVSVSTAGEAQAQQSALRGRSTYWFEAICTNTDKKYAAGLHTSKAVQLPRP